MGGRGANSIKAKETNITNTRSRNRTLSYSLENRQGLTNYIKQQINVDISPYIEERAGHTRTYLGVHLEKMSRNDRNSIRNLLQNSYNNNMRIENNGGLGYAIFYKKKRK